MPISFAMSATLEGLPFFFIWAEKVAYNCVDWPFSKYP